MYLKVAGSVIIIAFSAIAGLKMAGDVKVRILQLKMLKQFLILLRGEIKYNNSPLADALRNIKSRSSKMFTDMLEHVIKQIDSHDKKMFKDIWKEGVLILKKDTCLNDSDLVKFLEFGENLGFLDISAQINNIDLYLENLDMDITEAVQKSDDRCRIYNVCGLLTGIFIVLLIV